MKYNRVNLYPTIILSLFGIMLFWWFFININGFKDINHNFYYGALLGVLPIISSIFGFINANRWGGFKSYMGQAVGFLSAGLLTWGIGTLIFAYYNIILEVEVPYPSLADLFYIISWPLWALSMIRLSKATGVRFQLANIKGRVTFFIIPIVTILVSYYLLIIVARGGVVDLSGNLIKTFFDLAYPVGDIVILTIALLIYGLSFNYLGGIFKWPILGILFGFIMNYLGDFSFVYTVTQGTYFVANWVDLAYTIAFFMLSWGVSMINPHKLSPQN